ncbi:hypothetical protein [Catalinimonas alkaloidigena]|nr:hypothetical protein [Catalinimonas alkaloidigena]
MVLFHPLLLDVDVPAQLLEMVKAPLPPELTLEDQVQNIVRTYRYLLVLPWTLFVLSLSLNIFFFKKMAGQFWTERDREHQRRMDERDREHQAKVKSNSQP